MIEAVIFDLDGVIIDSEQIWDDVRERYVRERGGRYDAEAQRAMMGMSSTEWSRFIHEELGVEATPAEINAEVVELMAARYRDQLPVVPGAREAVERMAASFPLGLASSSNRPLIDTVLELAGLSMLFRATVSSEEVPRGKPAPDVYVEAGAAPRRRARAVCGDRGLALGNPLGEGSRHARGRDPESALSAGRRRARGSGYRPDVDRAAHTYDAQDRP